MSAGAPEFLTVEQAAVVIGIGRTCAYQLARLSADHGEGNFPAIRFGKQLRVPRRKLEALTGGPISLTTDEPAPSPTEDTTSTDHHDLHHRPTTNDNNNNNNNTNTTNEPDQPHLPFTTP